MTRGAANRSCAIVALTVLVVACGADGPDGYTASLDAAPSTARTLPTTSVPAPTDNAAVAADSAAATNPPAPATVAPVPPNGEVVQVRSLDNSYRVADIEVVAGTEILWTNNGRNDHNVLPVDESQTWGVDTEDFLPGDEYRHVFDTPGTYLYYCSIHGTKTVGMVGSVVVFPSA